MKVEIELIPNEISKQDNIVNVEMSKDEIWFLKHFIKKYNPKKIVEVGISAGGNTVNLLKWKDKDAQLFSVDIATQWYQDKTKLSGWMADEIPIKENWKIYRGYDYLDVYKEIGNDIDLIIIDTVHFMPGEFLTFIAALPQLKDGCIVILHDIHLNILRISGESFDDDDNYAYCTGLLYGGVSSNKKWSLKNNYISNIGAFVVDNTTRNNIKDIFRILCSAWQMFPLKLKLNKYLQYVYDNYPIECYNLFSTCLKAQANYFNVDIFKTANAARVDIINRGDEDNTIEFLNVPELINVDFPDWFKSENGSGAVIKTQEKSFDLTFKCINNGQLEIALRGPNIRDKSNNLIPHYVDFNKFNLNDEKIIKNRESVWHDSPYIFQKVVFDGDIINLHVEWDFFRGLFQKLK